MQPTPVLLPGESRGQRSLVGYSPWGRTESDTTERLSIAQYSEFQSCGCFVFCFSFYHKLFRFCVDVYMICWGFSLID